MPNFYDDKQLSEMVRKLPAAAYERSIEGTILWVNDFCLKIFGCSNADELIGHSIHEFYQNPEDAGKLIEKLEKSSDNSISNHLVKMNKMDKAAITVSVSGRMLFDNENNPISVQGVFTDVTQQAWKSELLDEFGVGYYLVDKNDKFTDVNTAFAEMFKFDSPEAARAFPVEELYITQEDEQKLLDKLNEPDGGPVRNFRSRVIDRKGEIFWILVDCQKVINNHSQFDREGTARDITKLVTLEERLARNKKEISSILHQIKSSKEATIITARHMIEEIEAWHDKKYNIHIVESEYDENITSLIKSLRKFENFIAEELTALKEKSKFSRYSLLISELSSIFNNTEEDSFRELKIAEVLKKIYRSHILITDYYYSGEHEDFNDSYYTKFDFNSVQSTEKKSLKSYQTSKKANELLLDLEKAFYKLLILFSLKSAWSIVNDVHGTTIQIKNLLEILGGEAVTRYNFRLTNLKNCIRRIVDLYQDAAKAKNVVILAPEGSITNIECDETQMDFLFSNLIDNAVKYSYYRKYDNPGYIKIKLLDLGANVGINIENYGVGVTEEEKAVKIFEDRYRGKYSIDLNRTGSGMGLAICRRIVEAHHGEISFRSVPMGEQKQITGFREVPHLTTVRITLPKKQPGEGE